MDAGPGFEKNGRSARPNLKRTLAWLARGLHNHKRGFNRARETAIL